jgi:serine O-acetyltransferase
MIGGISVSVLKKLLRDAVELTRARALATGPGPAPELKSILKQVTTNDSFQLLALFRIRESARRFRIPGANHILRRTMTAVYGLEIGNQVTLGEGIDFVHPIGIVIGGDARIGNRVRFMGNNTVGTAKENGYPVIEDDVTIGAGARILGPIRVGKGAIIGANAVVIRDVPAGAIVTGIPGVNRMPRSSSDAANDDALADAHVEGRKPL